MYPDPSGSHVAWKERASKSLASKIDLRRASVSGGTWGEAGVGERAGTARAPTSQEIRVICFAVMSVFLGSGGDASPADVFESIGVRLLGRNGRY